MKTLRPAPLPAAVWWLVTLVTCHLSLVTSAFAQPGTAPTNVPLTVNRTTGAIVSPVNAATFASANSLSGGGGISDGDKGDITVSASGATWTIDAGVVSLSKMANMATTSLLGRSTGGTGAPEVLSASTARTLLSLVPGTDVQAFSSNLSLYAAITPSANIQTFLGAADYSAMRTQLSLGSLALLNSVNNSNWSGTVLATGNGGTGNAYGPTSLRDTWSPSTSALSYNSDDGGWSILDANAFLVTLGGATPTGSGGIVRAASPTFSGAVTFPNVATPTTSSAAATAFDNNAWATSRGALQVYDGTANTYVVATLASDTPTAGQVPKYNASGYFTFEDDSTGGGGVSDGDKGDITISSSGTVYTIDAGAVSLAKMADMATTSLLGRSTGGTGAPEVLSASTARSLLSLVPGTDVQAFSSNLSLYAAITPSANIQTFLGAADYSAMRTQLSLVPGTNVQAYDAKLGAWAGLTWAADKLGYFTGTGSAATTDLSSFARTFLDDANAAAARVTLGLDNYTAHGNAGASEDFDWSVAWHSVTLDQNTTFTDSSAPSSGTPRSIVIEILQDATGSRTIDWSAITSNAPTISTAANSVTIVQLSTRDGGTTVYATSTADGGGDFSSNTATSVDSEFVLFSSTGGKTGKRASGTGLARGASGVASFAELSGDATTSGSNAVTLATVNSNVGTFGSATQTSTVTVNAKGLVTAASNTTITPAVGSITGLGTGVATALAINTGSAGAPVLFNGAGGTPSSLTLTNGTSLPISTGVSGLGTGVATALAATANGTGGIATPDGTKTLTNTTFDAAATGNVLKAKSYIYLTHPHIVQGTNSTIGTTSTSIAYGHATFSGSDSIDQADNWADYYFQVPEDIDTSVALRGRIKILLGNTDTATHRYVLSSVSVADSAVPTASTLANAINVDFAGDGSGANGDVETSAWTTLTSWAGALTAGQTWRIRLARDGNATEDASTVNSTELGLVIEYGITQ